MGETIKTIDTMHMDGNHALIVLVIALFNPAVAWIVAGVLKGADYTKPCVIFGIICFLLTPLLFAGWIWSLVKAW